MIFKRRAKSDPTADFWAWWAGERSRVERCIAEGDWDEALVARIGDLVSAIAPGLAWEFGSGSGTGSRHLLVVTADGNPKLRATAERWLRAGPPPDETFAYAASRLAAPEALESRLEIAGRSLDLAELRFEAEVDEQALQVDVRVWHPEFGRLPEDDRVQIAFLALDWLLGEDGVEIWVREIDASPSPGPSETAPPQTAPSQTAPSQTAKELLSLVAGLRPQRALMTGERGGRPVVATVQVPLRPARWPAADIHVRLEVPFRSANPGGLPIEPSLGALRSLEDHLDAYADGPVIVAHETSNGVRTFHLYADRRAAADALEPLVAAWPEGRVRMRVNHDPGWDGVEHLRPGP